MRRSAYILGLIACLMGSRLAAQELNCSVKVQAPTIQGIDPQIFQNMQKEIYEFMNLRQWTTDEFKPEERIKCNLNIVFTGGVGGSDRFEGTLQIQVIRPVLNSDFETITLNFNDKHFNINYVPFQTVQFSDNSYVNNISSLLMFWGYVILGIDYDTFGPEGGTVYFEKARNIMNLALNSRETGWQAQDGNRTRYWLIENLLNNSYKSFRTAYYAYHRKGLDQMTQDVKKGRAEVLNSLQQLERLFAQNPNLFIIRVFTDAKTNELVPMFKQSEPATKQQFIRMMTRMDPNNATKYDSVLEN
ncbi:MAG: DUF4835 family protein [Bacteroidetes bacterium]|jgi:hypothetical protein|nr:DUF4835 family protein [Bacteroidota bacterium]